MSKPPLATAAEGMSALQTLRTIISEAEDDMRKIADLALLVHDKMSETGPMPDDIRGALSWNTDELLTLGKRMAELHDALHDAVTGKAASDTVTAGDTVRPPHADKTDLDGAFANLAHTVANLHWFMMSNMRRVTKEDGERVYEIGEGNGDEFFSILYIADNWARGVAKENAL